MGVRGWGHSTNGGGELIQQRYTHRRDSMIVLPCDGWQLKVRKRSHMTSVLSLNIVKFQQAYESYSPAATQHHQGQEGFTQSPPPHQDPLQYVTDMSLCEV